MGQAPAQKHRMKNSDDCVSTLAGQCCNASVGHAFREFCIVHSRPPAVRFKALSTSTTSGSRPYVVDRDTDQLRLCVPLHISDARRPGLTIALSAPHLRPECSACKAPVGRRCFDLFANRSVRQQ